MIQQIKYTTKWNYAYRHQLSWDSVVSIANGYGLEDRGVGVWILIGSRIFSMSSRQTLGPTQPGIQWVPGGRGYSGRGMNLTTHLQLVMTPRQFGSIPPLPHTPWWHSAWLVKHKDNFTFSLYLHQRVNREKICWTWGSHSGNYEELYLLRYIM
jgi:hypothetical protein